MEPSDKLDTPPRLKHRGKTISTCRINKPRKHKPQHLEHFGNATKMSKSLKVTHRSVLTEQIMFMNAVMHYTGGTLKVFKEAKSLFRKLTLNFYLLSKLTCDCVRTDLYDDGNTYS